MVIHNITISWRDQLIANFTGRLNARARDISSEQKMDVNAKLYNFVCDVKNGAELNTDKEKLMNLLTDFQEKVLEEMMVNL